MNAASNTGSARLAQLRWQGELEGMHGNWLYGWAIDRMHPEARVVLQLCLNGEPYSSFCADIARPDVPEIRQLCQDVCHGFVVDATAIAGEGQLTVQVANAGVTLHGDYGLERAKTPPHPALSTVFHDGGLRLIGFARSGADPAQAVRIRAFCGAQEVASTVANLDHPHLRAWQVGNHGFILDLPLTLADGTAHSISVVDESGYSLNGSPLDVCCYASGAEQLLVAGNALPLLQNVIRAYETYLPRSVGWGDYGDWAKTFIPGAVVLPSSDRVVGLLLCGATVQKLPALHQPEVDCRVFATGPDNADFIAALTAALASPAGWLACIRDGDTLPPYALGVALAGARHAQAEIIYTDSEAGAEEARLPWFKPAWNPEYALATDYPLELMLIKTASIRLWLEHHPWPENAAALAWGMLAEVWDRAGQAIVHVPHVLYRFSTPLSPEERVCRLRAAQAALARIEPVASLTELAIDAGTDCSARRLQRSVAAGALPRVSLIIPTRDQATMLESCIASLLHWTDYPDLEIIIADNDSAHAQTKTLFRKLARKGIQVVATPGPFNFARINNEAVAACSGDVIGLINNDIEAMHPGWLQEMLAHLMQDDVGAVGAKLLWPNQMVQHGGIVLGMNHVAGHFGNLLLDTDPGDHARNQVALQVSGVTAACLLMRKADYLSLGGMDEVAFPVAFNDVDLCLRLRARGKSIIWTPFARLLHAESASRGKEDTPQKQARARREVALLRQRWGSVLLHDPAYHPSLNLDSPSQAFAGLALPPRKREPRLAGLVFDKEK